MANQYASLAKTRIGWQTNWRPSDARNRVLLAPETPDLKALITNPYVLASNPLIFCLAEWRNWQTPGT